MKLATTNDLNTVKQLCTKNEEKIENLQIHDSSLFIGQSYFGNDGSQNVLIFQAIYKTFKMSACLTKTIVEWESKWLSNENIEPSITVNHSFSPKLRWMNNSKVRA